MLSNHHIRSHRFYNVSSLSRCTIFTLTFRYGLLKNFVPKLILRQNKTRMPKHVLNEMSGTDQYSASDVPRSYGPDHGFDEYFHISRTGRRIRK